MSPFQCTGLEGAFCWAGKMKKKLHRDFLKRNERLKEHLTDLRIMVDTINRAPDLAMRQGIYRELKKTQVFVARMDGVSVGYKLVDGAVFMKRVIFVKFPGYKIEEIPDEDMKPILATIFDVFIDWGQQVPSVDITPNGESMIIKQAFLPLLLVKDPNLKKGEGKADDGPSIH